MKKIHNTVRSISAEVVHRLPGRIRILVPGLRGNGKLTLFLKKNLESAKGVYLVECNPLTGRVLLIYNARETDEKHLLRMLTNLAEDSVLREPKPEDPIKESLIIKDELPIKRQLVNVVLGGGVLAYLGIKHLLIGRTPLAKNSHIFNLAAATTVATGYPLLRNGLQGLAKGRINHDLVMSGLALGTTLLRESIPGLMVMWLANLTILGQSLVLKSYRSAMPELPSLPGNSLRQGHTDDIASWNRWENDYSRSSMLPILGMASLSGLTGKTGGFQRTLSMLLAANPSPAKLAAPTAGTATMARAGKQGIFFRDIRSLEIMSQVDTVIIAESGIQPEPAHQVGSILTIGGISKTKLLNLAALGYQGVNRKFAALFRTALASRRQHLNMMDNTLEKPDQILLGNEDTLKAAGIDTRWGVYKARRLRHTGQVPLFVAVNGKLVGLIGLKQDNAGDWENTVKTLRIYGVKEVIRIGSEKQTSEPEDVIELIRKLRNRGRKIAVFIGDAKEVSYLKEAHLGIALSDVPGVHVDLVISSTSQLAEAFRLSLNGEQRTRQNLALVQAANALGLVLGASGWLHPMAAKVFSDLTSVAVGFNSFRLLKNKSRGIRQKKGRQPSTAEKEIAAALEEMVNSCQSNSSGGTAKCSNWHSMSVAEICARLQTNPDQGLDQRDILQRLNYFGYNRMAEEKPQSFLSRIWGQLKDFLVKTLMVSAAVCGLLGEFKDALAILAILVINALLGAMQEQKAEGALAALGKMAAPTAKVRREGKVDRIPAAELVPGDIVILEQGDGVPADLRLLETHGLEIEESALTGEPYPVTKSSSRISDCVPLLDCENLAFMGTNVTRGRAVGVVVATGMSTEIGKIAGMLNDEEQQPTPLQNRMADVGSVILKYCLTVSGLVVLAGIIRGGSLFQMFLTGVSLAVAAIPEGLPAVVTIALASGVRRMAKENAVVRHLPAVETLGSATLICTDKTGTLTQNRQQVQSVYTAGGWWQAQPVGKPLKSTGDNPNTEDLASLLSAGVLCNDANLNWSGRKPGKGSQPKWKVDGDPTEGALLLAALREDINYKEIRNDWQRLKEIPFDAERLRMAVVCRKGEETFSFVKGAPEVVLRLCSEVQVNGEANALDEQAREEITRANEQMTGEAMRVLAIAYRKLDNTEKDDPENSLIFLGLIGMIDPPRPEVSEAIATCHRAGIKVVMITGDHPHTALAIAQKVGITDNNLVLTGQDIDGLSDLELAAALKQVRVFARVLPAQKLRLVKAYQSQGEVLAMVGDGINDAPAVKEANIGVAMGMSGTDVTKQAADIVLTDDNFSTLVSAVEQGRGIYSNIRRSVRYLLSTNVGLVLLVFLTVVLGMPMPLIPIQLLFLNVLGDGLPALALGVEPPAKDLMEQQPRPAKQSFFADGLGTQIINRGLATCLVGLETFRRFAKQGDIVKAQTVTMASFIAGKLLFALECGERKSPNKNGYLLGSVALSTALLIGAIYLPFARNIFKTSSLGFRDISSIFGAAGLTYLLEKIFAASGQASSQRN